MSTDDLVVARPADNLRVVWDLMVGAAIQHVPVVQGDELVGLVSSWDMARVAIERGSQALDSTSVAEVMERCLVRLHPKASLREAAQLLGEGGFHSLPVANDDNELVGILTSSDVMRYLATGELRDG